MDNDKKALYIFLDEGGNLDFSPNGTKYFSLTSVTKERPFYAFSDLTDLKYNLIEDGIELEYFHASEDKQIVRDAVFNIINRYFKDSDIDNIIVEKSKTGPALTSELRFYPEMLGYLLTYVFGRIELKCYKKVIIFTDTIPVRSKKNAIEKSIKKILSSKLPKGIPYSILHHSSKSNLDLQIVDYCNWDIYRKWEKGDERSYKLIEKFIKSEFEIFKSGTKYYY